MALPLSGLTQHFNCEIDGGGPTGEGGRSLNFRMFKSIFFSSLNFIVGLPYLIKYYHIMFFIIVFLIRL